MKYYILAGEASGDLHGANLMKALFKEDPEADIRFWGGDLMQNVGGTLVTHYKERAIMGFVEVLLNLKKALNFIKSCKKDIAKYNPDVIIFIDNSGFNLRIAKWAKKNPVQAHFNMQDWAKNNPKKAKIIFQKWARNNPEKIKSWVQSTSKKTKDTHGTKMFMMKSIKNTKRVDTL